MEYFNGVIIMNCCKCIYYVGNDDYHVPMPKLTDLFKLQGGSFRPHVAPWKGETIITDSWLRSKCGLLKNGQTKLSAEKTVQFVGVPYHSIRC